MEDGGVNQSNLSHKTAGDSGQIKSKSVLVQIIALGLLLTMIVLYVGYRWMVTPRINPHPTKKVVVHGLFPFDRSWDMQIKTSYYTKNPQCEVTAKAFLLFPMAQVAQEMWVDIPVIREGGNRYSFTYYEDYFLPGYCMWEQRFVYSRKFLDGEWEHGNTAISGLNSQNNQINYECTLEDNLVPGRGSEARRKVVVCFDHLGRNNRFHPQIEGKELNFLVNPKIRYEYYDAAGNRTFTWKEGNEK